MTELALYDTARAALAEARKIDEVTNIRDKALAMGAYARLAENVELEQDAIEIRMRAERRLGQMLTELKQAGELDKGGRPPDKPVEEARPVIKLSDIGVSKDLSSRSQRSSGIAEAAFEAMVARMRETIAARRSKITLDLARQGSKKEQRDARERALADKQLALPEKKYGVIYADPEWQFKTYSRETGLDRAADNHYTTSATAEICARPVGDIAADDCVLFLWATVPMLTDALAVMAAWGFTYKSHAVWIKNHVGTGYWFRNKHELLLVGTRGKIPAPAMGEQWDSAIEAPLGEHSQKPARFYELIEHYFANLPKIELNARAARPGWDAWGAEAPTTAAGEPIPHDAITGEVAAA